MLQGLSGSKCLSNPSNKDACTPKFLFSLRALSSCGIAQAPMCTACTLTVAATPPRLQDAIVYIVLVRHNESLQLPVLDSVASFDFPRAARLRPEAVWTLGPTTSAKSNDARLVWYHEKIIQR